MLVRIHWWQRDMDALRASLERLAESAEASELIDEERYALTQLVRLAPDEQRYLDRLNLLGGLPDEPPDDFARPEEHSTDVPEFETFESNAATEATFSDPTASFADLNEETGVATDVATHVATDGADDHARVENVMRQELESVDFYIAQGYSDIAVDTLEMLERQFGSHPEIQSRREKLAGGSSPATEAAVFEFGGAEELAEATPVVEAVAFETETSFA